MLPVFSIQMKEGPCVLHAIHLAAKPDSIGRNARKIASSCFDEHFAK
jgi:hypothetical protein